MAWKNKIEAESCVSIILEYDLSRNTNDKMMASCVLYPAKKKLYNKGKFDNKK